MKKVPAIYIEESHTPVKNLYKYVNHLQFIQQTGIYLIFWDLNITT